MDLKAAILQNGFVKIPNFIPAEEISQLRQLIRASMAVDSSFMVTGPSYKGKTQPNAACVMPDIDWIFYHPKILMLMRELLGTEEIMFTSHCDVHSRTLSGWHKDDGMNIMAGGYFESPTYDLDDCHVYKVAIYLQDHFHNLAGLRVKRNSHRIATLDQGEEVYLKTKAGDVIVFDVRLTHSGQTDVVPLPVINKPLNFCLRGTHKIFHTRMFNIALKNIYDSIAGDRMSIFFTFGLPNDYTVKFARNNMRRQLREVPTSPIYLPEALKQKLIENKVLLAEDYFSNLQPLEARKR